jgi:hypothetical protein
MCKIWISNKKTHGNYSETTQYVTWRSLIQTDSEKEESQYMQTLDFADPTKNSKRIF